VITFEVETIAKKQISKEVQNQDEADTEAYNICRVTETIIHMM
jgi:hypothetical protein